jgi:hypothetical protein
MNHALIGELAGALAIIQIIPYIVSILRGHTKPERASYLIWLLVDVIAISSYIAVGARTTIWTSLVFVFTGLLVFILSIKHGMGGFSTFDIICLLLACIGVVIWVSTKNALIALYFSNFVVTIGYLPTIKKAYFFPRTENTLSWTLTAIASTLNIFALTTLAPHIALTPIRAAVTQGIVAYLLLFPSSRFKVRRYQRPHRVHAFLSHPVFAK